MITMNEGFLESAGSKYGIDITLPFRLQKRALLSVLGFPSNLKLKMCRCHDTKEVERLFGEYGVQGYPFLVIISEKPMSSLVTPLFVVNSSHNVHWRDNRGNKNLITTNKALSIIQTYSTNTWLEFSPYIWGIRTIAGRLIYTTQDNQILEIQQGTFLPNLMDDQQLPTYMGKLSFLDLKLHRYLEDSRHLQSIGYSTICPFSAVRDICKKMPLITSFEKLNCISQFPALEFAVMETGQLITIDVDWPSQWIDKGGNHL
jgi:hypothetical protein